MARKKKSKLQQRLRRQTAGETALRYDSEANAVIAAGRDVREQASGTVRAARRTAHDQIVSARAARPVAARSLSDALRAVGAGPSPEVATSSLGAAAGRDADGAKRRLAETKAGLDTELVQREQDARAGEGLAVRAARETRRSDLGKLSTRLQDIARERGIYASARMGELLGDASDRAVTKRGQDVTAANNKRSTRAGNKRADADRASREKIAADKLKADGKKKDKKPRASRSQIIDAQTAVDLARRQAHRAKSEEKADRPGAAALLIEGRDALKDPNTNQKIPGTKYQRVKQLFASVALDMEYDGVLSKKNLRRLHALGYYARDFGIKPPAKKPNPGKGNSVAGGGSHTPLTG